MANSTCQIPASGLPYAGDLSPQQAYDFLKQNDAVLVDVRTPEEWAAVGVPDVSEIGRESYLVSLKLNPGYVYNPHFEAQLEEALGGRKDVTILFMCKGGGRSQDAAMSMTANGYKTCYNIAGGYEGRPDMAGWSALGLPCKKGGAA